MNSNRHLDITPTSIEERKKVWEEFKNQPWKLENGELENGAVFSIQSLDEKKIALTPSELKQFRDNNPQLEEIGDGHTAFAIAAILNLPLGVLRSEGNRQEFHANVSRFIKNNGILVITGHGSTTENTISGTYKNVDSIINEGEQIAADEKIKRNPSMIVDSVMEANTLKSGDHLSILLAVCYGGYVNNKDASLADKLAIKFAELGINTTIIACEKPVTRFGCNAIKITENNSPSISFNNNIGMKTNDIIVFSTTVTSEGGYKQNVFKPLESLTLTSTGLKFSHRTVTEIVNESGGYYQNLRVYSTNFEINLLKSYNKINQAVCALRLSKSNSDALVYMYVNNEKNIQQILITRDHLVTITNKNSLIIWVRNGYTSHAMGSIGKRIEYDGPPLDDTMHLLNAALEPVKLPPEMSCSQKSSKTSSPVSFMFTPVLPVIKTPSFVDIVKGKQDQQNKKKGL